MNITEKIKMNNRQFEGWTHFFNTRIADSCGICPLIFFIVFNLKN